MRRFLLPLSIIIFLFTWLSKVEAQGNQIVTNGGTVTASNFPGTGCIYNWVNDTPSIGLPANGTGYISPFTGVNTGTTPVTATITATPVPAGFVYAANAYGVVTVMNTATNTLSATINFGNGIVPFGVSASPDGSRVYVTYVSNAPPYDAVSVINTATNAIVATIAVGIGPKYAKVSPDGSKLYVANFNSNTVSVINTATNTVSNTIAGITQADGIAVSPDGSKLYVAGSDGVSVINTSNNTIAATIAAGGGPTGLVISPDGSLLYEVNIDGITVINASTNTISATIPLETYGYSGIAIGADGSRVYVSNDRTAKVSVINTATNTIIDTITVRTGVNGLSVSPDGSHLYGIGGGSVKVISTVSDSITSIGQTGQLDNMSYGDFVTGNAVCTGAPVKFTITVNPNTAPFITSSTVGGNTFACMGTPSLSPYIGQFTVSGIKLTNDITVTAPAGFEVSLAAASGFGNAITIPQLGGIVDNKIVYVRSSASAPSGHITGTLNISSAGAASAHRTSPIRDAG